MFLEGHPKFFFGCWLPLFHFHHCVLLMAAHTHCLTAPLTSYVHICKDLGQKLQICIHHFTRFVVTDFKSSSYVIWNILAFTHHFCTLQTASWQVPESISASLIRLHWILNGWTEGPRSLLIFFSFIKFLQENYKKSGFFEQDMSGSSRYLHSTQYSMQTEHADLVPFLFVHPH